MALTRGMAQQLEHSLAELENAHNISKTEFWAEDATDLSLEQIKNTLCYSFVREDVKQLMFLAYKKYADTKKEIVWSITRSRVDTGIEEDRLVTWEVEEIAKEFCKNHGLIPDLIKCLNQAEAIFTDIQSLVAEYDCFHVDDYEEEGHIVIRVEVSSDQQTALGEYDALNNWMLENMSDDNLEYFVVTVRRTG